MKSSLTDAYTIKLEVFEGPFDLLFFLIEKNQIDLYDIPISEISDQYLDYLKGMQELDLEIASEFLVMAATLLHIKSRMLLPNSNIRLEEEVDPREELILRLVEYKKYKEFSTVLKERDEKWGHMHYKLPEVIPEVIEDQELEVSSETLQFSYISLLKKYRGKMDDVSQKMERILNREKVSIRSKIKELTDTLKTGIKVCFSKLFNRAKRSRLEVATAFLAMLEIVKAGEAQVEQVNAFGEIIITNAQNERSIEPLNTTEDNLDEFYS